MTTDFFSFQEIREALSSKSHSCVEITQSYLDRIHQNTHLNAFIEVFEDEALSKAKEIDEKIKVGAAGKLAGMVIGIKDNICYKDHQVTASSKILQGFTSLFSATVIERLIQEDAIIIGRLNCDEFAMGSSNENSYYGVVKNPIDETTVPGGSSGGSAAAVKANLCLVALGSDTGGSIRQPAAFCDVFGLKPTYGRVSRHGLIAYASSFDQIGPIAHNIEDISRVMEVISGSDNFDSTCSKKPIGDLIPNKTETKKYKIAYFGDSVNHEGLDTEIHEAFQQQVSSLKSAGHQVEEISFGYLKHLIPTYYILTTAEASSNLSRYDGMRYGYRSEKGKDIQSTYKHSRAEGFGKEVKRRILLGTFVLSAGYYDAYYTKAQKVRRIIKDKTNDIFKEFDFIIQPTTANHPFKIGSRIDDPIKMYLEDIYTVHANLAGIPAISIPIQHKEKKNIPIGFQIMANNFCEKELLQFGHQMTSINNEK